MTEMFIEIRIYCIHRNYRLGSDACYFDGFSMIGCPLHFNYRRQKMFQTRQTREKHMKTSHTLPTQTFAWNSTLSSSATLWHMSIIGGMFTKHHYIFCLLFSKFRRSQRQQISEDRTVCIHKGLNLTSLRSL